MNGRKRAFNPLVLFLAGLGALDGSVAQASGYYNRAMFVRPAGCGSGVTRVQSVPPVGEGSYVVFGSQQSQSIVQGAGNLVVAVAVSNGIGEARFSVTDTLGNVWHATPAQGGNATYTHVQVFFAQSVPAGSNTVTLTQSPGSSASTTGLTLVEYAGVASSAAVDGSNGRAAGAPSSVATAGSLTLASDCNDLVVAAFVNTIVKFNAPTAGMANAVIDAFSDSLVSDNAGSLALKGSTVNSGASASSADSWIATQVAFRIRGSTPVSPARLAITSAPQSVGTTWQCSGALTVQLQDASLQPVRAGETVPLGLSSSGSMEFFSDSSCTELVTSSSVLAGVSTRTLYFKNGSAGSSVLTVSSPGLVSATQNQSVTALTANTWVGGGACSGNWASPSCWSGGSVPSSAGVVHFDSNCASNCTASLTTNRSIGGLAMHQGSTDRIDVSGYTLTVSGETLLDGGDLSLGGGALLAQGDLTIRGGSHQLGGKLQVAQNYRMLGGTPAFGATQLVFNDNLTCNNTWIVDPGTATYGEVRFEDASTCVGTHRQLTSSSVMNVSSKLVLGATVGRTLLAGGTIQVYGDLIAQNLGVHADYDPTLIRIVGPGNHLIDASSTSTGFIPSLAIVADNQVTFVGAPIVQTNFSYVTGTVDFGTSTLVFNDPDLCNTTWTIDPGGIAYGNVRFADDTAFSCTFVERVLPSSATMNVTGLLTLAGTGNAGRLSGGKIAARGDVTVGGLGYVGNDGYAWPPTELSIEGAGNQVVDASPATTAFLPSLAIASTGGTVRFSGTPVVSANYAYLSGTVDFASNAATLKFNDPLNCNPNWGITPGAGVPYHHVALADATNCAAVTRTIQGAGIWTVNGTLTLSSSVAQSYLIGGQILANGNVVVQSRAYRTTSTINVAGNWSSTAATPFMATAGTVSFAPGASHGISGSNTFFNLRMDDNASGVSDTLTLSSGNTQTITGLLYLRGSDAGNLLRVVSATAGSSANLVTPAQTMGGFLSVQDVLPSNALNTGIGSVLLTNTGLWVSP